MYDWSFFSWQGHPRREGHSIMPIKAMDKVRLLPLCVQGLVPTEAALSSFTMNCSPVSSVGERTLGLGLAEDQNKWNKKQQQKNRVEHQMYITPIRVIENS
ncbi:hypothetical protein AVEN_260096-1 [Araneus ventricosus]|uniref:Uncharacterized protein n=1 Tax=Araneus ventricosus TaxID=182803 RepID=A0A4Y2NK14_ARAVE|nr:hypothetical protein AVEN_260096-1 [Araneus ventricosus]